MSFYVYLSGEIHTNWRDEIQAGAEKLGLDIVFTAPVTDHDASDAAGDMLGAEDNNFWRDHKSAKVNAIRTQTLIEQADLVVVRFGDKYRSEERRVGKECRSRWWTDHEKEKKR